MIWWCSKSVPSLDPGLDLLSLPWLLDSRWFDWESWISRIKISLIRGPSGDLIANTNDY